MWTLHPELSALMAMAQIGTAAGLASKNWWVGIFTAGGVYSALRMAISLAQ